MSLQKGVYQLPIHRSRSVPALAKEGSLKQMDYLFRVVHTTPKDAEHTGVTSIPSVATGTGKLLHQMIMV